jgi:hypothetical protein
MGDCLSAERRLVEAALVRLLARAAVPEAALASLVEACAKGEADWATYRGDAAADPAETAFEVNAGGLADQVCFVLDHCGIEEGERRLMQLVWHEDVAAA